MSRYFTFWTGGPLSPVEELSITSFVRRGHRPTVFTYEDDLRVPDGAILEDARAVIPLGGLAQACIEARRFALLSNFLRYAVLGQRDAVWFDTDVVLLADDIPEGDYVFGRQDHLDDDASFNGAVLGLPPTSALLQRLNAVPQEQALRVISTGEWGTFGPKLLTRHIRDLNLVEHALPVEALYPIHFRQTWRMYHPESLDWCLDQTHQSSAIHLWNEVTSASGLKGLAPPTGSFLAELYRMNGVTHPGRTVTHRELDRWSKRLEPSRRSLIERLADGAVRLVVRARDSIRYRLSRGA